jgi:hypothetical protein
MLQLHYTTILIYLKPAYSRYGTGILITVLCTHPVCFSAEGFLETSIPGMGSWGWGQTDKQTNSVAAKTYSVS